MAQSSEIARSASLIGKFQFASASSLISYCNLYQKNKLLRSGVLVRLQQGRLQVGRAATSSLRANRTDLITEGNFVPAKSAKIKAKALVCVRNKNKEDLKEIIAKRWNAFGNKFERNVVLELVSTKVDSQTKVPQRSREAVLKETSKGSSGGGEEKVQYQAEFVVDPDFGAPGAIMVNNKNPWEFFLDTITIVGFPCGPIHFLCNSWVQPHRVHPEKRVFFSNQPYVPSKTPAGLRALRQKELRELRGDGKGERKLSDRVYDFDVYNDLGNPEKSVQLGRPVLGGEGMFFYPRRCRTGRRMTHSDTKAESQVEKTTPVYVPRDEQFGEGKQDMFSKGRIRAVLHNLIPSMKASISSENHNFKAFSDIDVLYKEGLLLKAGLQDEIWRRLPLPKVVTKLQESSEGILRYDPPKIISNDKFAWLRDDEFARQAIAGVNPVNIERLKSFPPESSLDPEIHGPQESAFKEEHIIGHIGGMSVEQALKEDKLFIVNYHDVYLPFLDRINALDGRKAYATRTLFFLTSLGTLKPIAIELGLPQGRQGSRPNRVVTPPVDATTSWIWQLAKAHVCSNDAGVHQLVNHWLRTHACVEPLILAAHRRLSAMHPIFMLLDPHMRYTLDINGLARQSLINADGVIETCFTPGRYCMQISAAAYKNSWRFDMENLPADLIRRGVAVRDAGEPHGLKLLIEDYPYAQDGLLIWSAIENWVRAYVNQYYQNSSLICSDKELQAWYDESVNVGHADHRHADWWPTLANKDSLVLVLATIIWLASAQHAALNFGQYPYGGYVPNRPPLMRRLIPEQNDLEYANFLADSHKFFLSSLPSLLQATNFMAVAETLSTHSPDEQYLGTRPQPSLWSGDAKIIEAFSEFSNEIGQIEKEIERRNSNPTLRNRCGAGVLPYELLTPTSQPGVTCRGIPNSVSI